MGRIAHLKRERAKKQVRHEYPGRPMGQPHGTHVTDEAELKKCVILCEGCAHKFDPKKYHYYLTREFKIQGRCDGCKQHSQRARFFIHESSLGRKHGQCWTPR